MARRIALTLAFVTTVLAAPDAGAQVNAEALRTTLKANPRFLWLEGALVGHAGNTSTLTFSGSVFGGIVYGHNVIFVKASADYGQAMSTTNVARWNTHARYNYNLTEDFAFEGFVQVQHDRFRRIEVRDLYGLGVRYSFYRDKDNDVFAGTTYMLEHETIDSLADGTGAEKNVWNRNSTYFGINAKITALLDASSVTYIQPRLDRPSDFRVMSESWMSAQITKRLAVKVTGTFWYDNDPPLGVKQYDLEIKNSLALKLD